MAEGDVIPFARRPGKPSNLKSIRPEPSALPSGGTKQPLARPAKSANWQSIKEPAGPRVRTPSPSDPSVPFGEGTSGKVKIHASPSVHRVLPEARASGQLRDLGFHAAGGYDTSHKAMQAFHGGGDLKKLHQHGRQLQKYAQSLKKSGAHPEELKKIRMHLGGLSTALHAGDKLATHEHLLGLQHGFFAAHHGFQTEHGPGSVFPQHRFAPPAGADASYWNASQSRLQGQIAEAPTGYQPMGKSLRQPGGVPPGSRTEGEDPRKVHGGGGGTEEPQEHKPGLIERIGGAVVDPLAKAGKKLGLFEVGDMVYLRDGSMGTVVLMKDDVPGELIKLADVHPEHKAVLEKHGYKYEGEKDGSHHYSHSNGGAARHRGGWTQLSHPNWMPTVHQKASDLEAAVLQQHGEKGQPK